VHKKPTGTTGMKLSFTVAAMAVMLAMVNAEDYLSKPPAAHNAFVAFWENAIFKKISEFIN
jgi:hypothetical protein